MSNTPLWKQKKDAGELNLSEEDKRYFKKVVSRDHDQPIAKQLRALTGDLVSGGYLGAEIYSNKLSADEFELFVVGEVDGFEEVTLEYFNSCFEIESNDSEEG